VIDELREERPAAVHKFAPGATQQTRSAAPTSNRSQRISQATRAEKDSYPLSRTR
jgi:hypothetical protein